MSLRHHEQKKESWLEWFHNKFLWLMCRKQDEETVVSKTTIDLDEALKEMRTGDIILFNGQDSVLSKVIEIGLQSPWSHCGIVVKNPQRWIGDDNVHINNNNEIAFSDLYLWQSGQESRNLKPLEDDECPGFIGVQMTPLVQKLQQYDGVVAWRRYSGNAFDEEKLKTIHERLHKKPYDLHLSDWIEGLVGVDTRPQKEDRFWCSALLGYIFVHLGMLPAETDWSIMRPTFFADPDMKIDTESGKYEPFQIIDCY